MIYQKSVTSLTFYGGVNEIGGNKILLEDKDTRVFLDFGKSPTNSIFVFLLGLVIIAVRTIVHIYVR